MDEHPWSKKLYRLLRERDEALLDIFAPIYAYVNLKKNELSQIEVKALEKAQDLSRSLNSHLITLLRDEITQLKEKIKECTNELEASKDRLLVLDSSNIEASKSIQILADENHALQLELHSRETELGILKKEHDRLINRWLEYKAKEVEKMNAEHEQQMPITIVGEKEQAVKTTLPESIGLSLRKLHTDQIRCISFSHCQSWVASGGVDCKAFLHFPFSDASKDPVEITSCSNSITSISCSKYGSQILLGLNDGGLQVANVDSKQNIKISAVLSGHIGTVSSAYFLPKSQKAVFLLQSTSK